MSFLSDILNKFGAGSITPAPVQQQPQTVTTQHPNFQFRGTGTVQTPGHENWVISGGSAPVPTPQSTTFTAPNPNHAQIPTGWTYSDMGDGTTGWHNPQGQPAIMPHYITPGGLPPAPQYIDPVRKQQLEMRMRSV